MSASHDILRELFAAPADRQRRAVLYARAAEVDDWSAVIDEARRANLLGLLAQELEGAPAQSVPPSARAALDTARIELARRGLRDGGALVRILGALDRHGIAALPFKGPVLSQRAYHDPGLRLSADLDVLVHRHDVGRAADALSTIGYAIRDDIGDARSGVALLTECEATFTHAGGPPLEIHWKALPGAVNRRLDLGALLPHARAFSFLGRTLTVPDDADTLILQAAHGWKHGWLEIEAIAAMSRLIGDCGGDVAELALRRADGLRFRRRLLLGFALVDAFTGIPASGRIADAIVAADVGARVDQIVAAHASPSRLAEVRRKHYAARPGWQHDTLDGRADVVLCRFQRVTWPSARDRASIRLPRRLAWLYWIVRPLRVAVDAARRRRRRHASGDDR